MQPQARGSSLGTTTPVLFARATGPSVGQRNRSSLPRAAIVAPAILAALALLVLVALGYSRYGRRHAVSVIQSPILLHDIDDPEELAMWEVHVALTGDGDRSTAVEAGRYVFAGMWSWSEITVRRTPVTQFFMRSSPTWRFFWFRAEETCVRSSISRT